ncbi:GAF domain-containing protein [Leifsonia sp. H3M29-4]|uniref:GAF domain-containing protein n=1 Tax=Salinibacterium metalliresistens TaxID=3031321 RepID=UPI0023D9AB95|nr:GAF domain-containing protein [Salinibacterium metalliresistens]MDF1478088.1 GAF domain-containing protein [Salinibacterium metalliresistens]
MLASPTHLLFAPLIAWWLASATKSWRQMPTPGERPVSFAAGSNADRVLLVGGGIAVGYGVSSADLALGGYLARGLTPLTGRGASVHTVARGTLRAADVEGVLANLDLGRFDALMINLGSDEALRLVSPRAFAQQVSGLLDWLHEHVSSRLGVIVVGVPDVTSVMRMPRPLARVVRHQCARLDAVLKSLCGERDWVTYLPFEPAVADLERDGDRRLYAAWSALIVPTLARVLDAQIANPRDPATIQELRRQQALDDLRILDTGPEERFDRIVKSARDLFGIRGASITFIDRDRQWTKASVGGDVQDSPRGSALGDATVHNGKLLVIEDASTHELFRGHPWVANGGVRFFAGFPIEAANGERIGALCLTDPNPRGFSAADDSLLGMLARQVQVELWGIPEHG